MSASWPKPGQEKLLPHRHLQAEEVPKHARARRYVVLICRRQPKTPNNEASEFRLSTARFRSGFRCVSGAVSRIDDSLIRFHSAFQKQPVGESVGESGKNLRGNRWTNPALKTTQDNPAERSMNPTESSTCAPTSTELSTPCAGIEFTHINIHTCG